MKFLSIVLTVSLVLVWSTAAVSAGTYLQYGKVVDAENNAPLHGAAVFAGERSSDIELVVTGQDGRYMFSKNHAPSANSSTHSGNQTIFAIYHPGYIGFTKALASDPQSEELPVIRLNRVTPQSHFGKINAELLKNIETLTYFYNDRELNPAIKFKILLKSAPDIELLLEQIAWEKIVRREEDIEKEERFSFGREWRDAYDESLESRLDTVLKKGTGREKVLALILLPKPRCEDVVQPIMHSVLGTLSDPDPAVREMAAFYVRSSLQKSNRAQDLPTHINDPVPLSGANPLPKNPNVAYGFSRKKRAPGTCDSPPIVDALLKATADSAYRVRMEAAFALGYSGEQRAVSTLIALLADPDPFVRMAAAVALGELRAKDGAAALASLATSSSSDWRDFLARREALNSLRKIWATNVRRVVAIGPKGDIPQDLFDENLRAMTVNAALKVADDLSVRREAFGLLAEIKVPEAVGLFRRGCVDSDPFVRFNALRGLLRLADDNQVCSDCNAVFAAASTDADTKVRAVAISGLGRVMGRELNEDLLEAVHDPNAGVRDAAISSIRSTDSKSLEKLAALLDEKQEVRELALRSLYQTVTTNSGPSARQRREPVQAKSGRSYMWIEPDSRHNMMTTVSKERGQKSKTRFKNDMVVEKILAIFPKLAVAEKTHALEILNHFDHTDISPFLLNAVRAVEPDVAIKAMEISSAYAPADSFPLIAKKLADKDSRIREAAEIIVSSFDIDIPVNGFVWMAEDADPGIRKKFYRLARNLSDPSLVPVCLKGLTDPVIEIRKASAEYFREHPDRRSVVLLSDLLKSSKEEASVAAMALATQDDSAFDLLLEIIADTTGKYDVDVKRDVLFGIVNHDPGKTGSALSRLLENAPDAPIASDIIRALVGLKAHSAVSLMVRLLEEGNNNSNLISHALFFIADPSVLKPLQGIIENPDAPLQKRKWAIQGCAGIGVSGTRYLLGLAKRTPELRQAAVEYLQIQKPEDRRATAEIAGENPGEYREIVASIGGAFYRIPLELTGTLLRDKNPRVVKGAILLLRATGNPKAIEYLREFENDRDKALRELVIEAVHTLEQKKLELEQKKTMKPVSKREQPL